MQIPLARQAQEPLYRQIAAYVQRQIVAGNLPPGSLLPPIRTLAERLGVSKTVVVRAYAELEAAGKVAGRVGAGTMVLAGEPAARAPVPPLAPPQRAPGAMMVHNDLLRLSQRSGLIRLTTNSPAMDHLPVQAFGRCLKAVMQDADGTAFAYDCAEGLFGLRQAIARYLVGRGIVAGPSEIVVTNGSQQAIDLVVRSLAGPGDWVLAESPCYMGALDAFAANGVRVAPVAVDENGMVLEQVEALGRELRPRLLYTNPTFQNPTGTTLALQRRQHLIELAARLGVPILEDGVLSELDLTAASPPALRALAADVYYCNSFSKVLLPGLRLGYLVAPPPAMRRLTLLKQAADVGSSGFLQRALARFLDAGLLAPHIERMQEVYRQRRAAMLQALADFLPADCTWSQPTGGLHVWVSLPPATDGTALYLAAIEAGVAFAPGMLFFAHDPPGQYLRLNYGAETAQRIRQGVACLGKLLAAAGAASLGALVVACRCGFRASPGCRDRRVPRR